MLKKEKKIKLNRSETEFLPALLEVTETPPAPLGHCLLWLICFLLLATITWAIIGQVDEISVAPGKIIPTGYVKVIQAEDKGTVKKILVSEGQRVKKGDLIMSLDSTISAADVANLSKNIGYLKLEIDRLRAEKEGVAYHPQAYAGVASEDLLLQANLYQTRYQEYQAKIAATEDEIKQNLIALKKAQDSLGKVRMLYGIAKKKEETTKKLVEQDAVGSFQLMDYQARRVELEEEVVSLENEAAKLALAVQQSREGLNNLQAERQKEIMDKLIDDHNKLQILLEEQKKAQERERYAQILAPVNGRVNQISVHTIGAVVTPAQSLMVIVPAGVSLEIEALVDNKDIAFIKVGQKAEIKIDAFNFQKYGTIPAQVTKISPDSLEDKNRGLVYKVNLKMEKESIIVNGQAVYFTPGMTVSAEIKTKKKHVIEYFLDPFKRYQSEALRER